MAKISRIRSPTHRRDFYVSKVKEHCTVQVGDCNKFAGKAWFE